MPTTAISELPPGYRLDPVTGAWLTIPWPTDPDEKAALIASSLGPSLIDWAEWRTDEPGLTDYLTGERWRFTDGQKRFLILWYAYDERGRWRYRSGVKRGAKGTGKDPFGAAMCDIELVGRSQLVRDAETGRWTGQRHMLPLVQIASNSEAQSKDMLRIANALFNSEARDYYGIDCGETRTILRDGGRLEVLTASEKSSEGDPATFIALNESHHMTESSGGHNVAQVARRNVAKSPAALQARVCEFTNAHREGMDSVAERSCEAWQHQVSGRVRKVDILYDSIEADPATDLADYDQLMRALEQAYQDAPWADLERLADEIQTDTRTSEADAIRYYLNGLAAAEDAWVDPRKFDALARLDIVVADGERIAMFLDCSKSDDATGLVAVRLSDGHVMTLGVWQRPHGERGKGWLAPRHEVDAIVRQAFDRYRVVWFGVDPSPAREDENESSYWMPHIDAWHRDFGRKLVLWATPGAKGHAVKFDMRLSQRGGAERNREFTEQAELVAKAIDEDAAITHDGDATLRSHTHNAKKRPNQWGTSLGKQSRDSKKKVDLAVCMVGAQLGRRLVLNSGKVRHSGGSGKVVIM
ncbi:terminase [Nocardia sp. NBC_01009]|uniref:terminase n=1 Tax=Nocardia sp. NBC_01009 TaxID=2975996 RepID=UPI003867AF90|nr:terminase [Nocardia sp. NBC_01009]